MLVYRTTWPDLGWFPVDHLAAVGRGRGVDGQADRQPSLDMSPSRVVDIRVLRGPWL